MIMCPIGHVPHPPRYPISIFNINHDTPLSMSHCPCVPLSMCSIGHVPHPPRCPISIFSINHDTHLPMCPIAHVSKNMSSCQKDVKLSERCQVVKKMSNVKKSNTLTMEEVHKKKLIHIMRFNFDIPYDGDQKLSKCA